MRPWEWELMTVDQTDALLGWLDDYKQQMDEAEAEARRG